MYTDTYNKCHSAVNDHIDDLVSVLWELCCAEQAPTRPQLPAEQSFQVCIQGHHAGGLRSSVVGVFTAQISANATNQGFAFQRAVKHSSKHSTGKD